MKQVMRIPNKSTFERLKNVAAYARVSSGKDAMLHSLAAQVSYYSQMIREQPGWRFVGVYADEGMTGTKDTREEFQRLLSDCRAGRIDMVITKSVSRFARNTVTSLETVRELKLLGIDVYFEEQKIHSMSGDGELMLTILSAFAQEESKAASDNQKWRIHKGFEDGELMCLRTMFGYNISKKNGIATDPKKAEIVREIYMRIIRGDTLNSISKWLNRNGVLGVLGGKWNATRVRDLISNEKYTGNALLQKVYINNHIEKKRIQNNGELPQYYATETHPAIIDQATYDAAQNALARISARHRPRTHIDHYVFSGMILCPACGKHFIRTLNHGRSRWVCPTFLREGIASCHSKKIPEEALMCVTSELFQWNHFDEALLRGVVDHITAIFPDQLVFYLKDGTERKGRWRFESRSKSWTPEMKAKAADTARRRKHGEERY